jgi:hypothetical protein
LDFYFVIRFHDDLGSTSSADGDTLESNSTAFSDSCLDPFVQIVAWHNRTIFI